MACVKSWVWCCPNGKQSACDRLYVIVYLLMFSRCDGGVCNNGFLVQMVSNLTGRKIDRPQHMDMTSLGAAFLAGLAVGRFLLSFLVMPVFMPYFCQCAMGSNRQPS